MKSLRISLGKLFWPGLMLLLLVPVTASAVMAAEQVPTPSDDAVNRVASQLYCPICDNISLDVCPLDACQAWHELIREQLAEGWTERDIKDYFVAQYGERVLGEPPRSGLNWLLYLLPPVIVLLGMVGLLTKMKRSAPVDPARDHPSTDLLLEQVERDLEKLD
jgi:cytochrome c-type biogenesis protein CcmH